jgi:tetratricopeptide (TPR) repeat protein
MRAAFFLLLAALYPAAWGLSHQFDQPPDATLQEVLADANRALSDDRFEQALSGFRKIVDRHPDHPEALFGLGVACVHLGRMEEARLALDRSVKLRPTAHGHSVLGIVLLASGMRTEARTHLESALRSDPADFEAAKALAHVEAGDYRGDRVVKLLQPFQRAAEFDDEARLLLATGLAQSGNDRQASSILNPLLERRPPPPPEIFVLAAASAMRAGDARAAAKACAVGLKEHPNSDDLEARCLDVARGGHLDSWIDHLESGLRGSPEDVPALILLGRLMTDAGSQTGAPLRSKGLEYLERAVAFNSSNASALYNLGRCLRVLSRPREAVANLERALTFRTDEELSTLLYTQIALAERDLQNTARAEEIFRRVLELNRKSSRYLPDPVFEFHLLLVSAGRAAEAQSLLDEILQRTPGFLPARMQRARELSKARKFQEAAKEAELVVDRADRANRALLRTAHMFLFQLYRQQGRHEDAKRHELWLKEQ